MHVYLLLFSLNLREKCVSMHEYDACLHLQICIVACNYVHDLIYIFYHTSSTVYSLWSILLQRATPTSMPSLSRNGTILLELKRRYVSQRLNELQITLGQIRRCQQHDSKSKDGTRGRTQIDSSSTQRGQREHYPGVDGCSPTDGQCQDRILATQDHSQQTVGSGSLGNYKLESHISEQQRSDTVQSTNPDKLLDCQMLESQDQLPLNVPGKQELSSQVKIENTTGCADIGDIWGPSDQILGRNVDK